MWCGLLVSILCFFNGPTQLCIFQPRLSTSPSSTHVFLQLLLPFPALGPSVTFIFEDASTDSCHFCCHSFVVWVGCSLCNSLEILASHLVVWLLNKCFLWPGSPCCKEGTSASMPFTLPSKLSESTLVSPIIYLKGIKDGHSAPCPSSEERSGFGGSNSCLSKCWEHWDDPFPGDICPSSSYRELATSFIGI